MLKFRLLGIAALVLPFAVGAIAIPHNRSVAADIND